MLGLRDSVVTLLDIKRRLVIFREMSEKVDYGFSDYDTRALPQKQSLIRLKTALNPNATSLLSQIDVVYLKTAACPN